MGVAIGEPVEHARGDLEQAMAEACADDPWLIDHPVDVEGGGVDSSHSGPIPAGSDLGIAPPVRIAPSRTGACPDVYGAPYGSDLRLLTGLGGIPTVQYGPGDAALAHGPMESVSIAEVMTTARTLAALGVDVCGVA